MFEETCTTETPCCLRLFVASMADVFIELHGMFYARFLIRSHNGARGASMFRHTGEGQADLGTLCFAMYLTHVVYFLVVSVLALVLCVISCGVLLYSCLVQE